MALERKCSGKETSYSKALRQVKSWLFEGPEQMKDLCSIWNKKVGEEEKMATDEIGKGETMHPQDLTTALDPILVSPQNGKTNKQK